MNLIIVIHTIFDKLYINKLFDKLKQLKMDHKLNTIKADFYKVFVDGNASNNQMARVFLMIALPIMVICMVTLR
jgi:hypothetical protein